MEHKKELIYVNFINTTEKVLACGPKVNALTQFNDTQKYTKL